MCHEGIMSMTLLYYTFENWNRSTIYIKGQVIFIMTHI